MIKSYHELIQIDTFEDRFEYLKLKGRVGKETFGSHRYLNQLLYKMPEWRSIRSKVIIRDNACDLAHPAYEIRCQAAYIHHINPITIDDILEEAPCVFDMDNLITTTFNTHQAIHYGGSDGLLLLPKDRLPNDTCPWK